MQTKPLLRADDDRRGMNGNSLRHCAAKPVGVSSFRRSEFDNELVAYYGDACPEFAAGQHTGSRTRRGSRQIARKDQSLRSIRHVGAYIHGIKLRPPDV